MHDDADANWWEGFFHGAWGQLQSEGYATESTLEDIDFLSRALALEPGESILDVPCGTGRHSVELAARGFLVTGIDFNPIAIATGRAAAAERGLSVRFLEGDMRSLELESEFGAAICFFGSFGYFDDAGNLGFARTVARALRPGGRFLIDTHVMESLLPKFTRRGWSSSGEGALATHILEERRWDLETGRVVASWTFLRGGAYERQVSSIRTYSYAELCALLRAAGFSRFVGLETRSGAPFDIGKQRLSLIAYKDGA